MSFKFKVQTMSRTKLGSSKPSTVNQHSHPQSFPTLPHTIVTQWWLPPFSTVCSLSFFGQNFRFSLCFSLDKTFVLPKRKFWSPKTVLGDLSRCFNCSIPLARFASYHHTRETLKRVLFVHTSLSMILSLSLSPVKVKVFQVSFFLQY